MGNQRVHHSSSTCGSHTLFLCAAIKDHTIFYIRQLLINYLRGNPHLRNWQRQHNQIVESVANIWWPPRGRELPWGCYKRSISPLDQIKQCLLFIPNIDFWVRVDITIHVNPLENKNGGTLKRNAMRVFPANKSSKYLLPIRNIIYSQCRQVPTASRSVDTFRSHYKSGSSVNDICTIMNNEST